MAEIIVSHLVKKLSVLVENEANLLGGVREQIKALHNQLNWMRSFLWDAEKKRSDSRVLEVWVSNVRDLAYEAEDVIDAFTRQVEERRNMRRRHIGLRITSSWKKFITLHRFGKLIKGINMRSAQVSDLRLEYYTPDVDMRENLAIMRKTTHIINEEVIVGFEDEAAHLAETLTTREGKPRRRVMSIVGMGGLGKTTLAQMVYGRLQGSKSFFQKKPFDIYVWAYASEDCQVKDLLMSILKQVKGGAAISPNMDQGELQIELKNQLQGKKYFVVIDDIWNKDDWTQVSPGLPDNQNDSRVLLTTRNKEVATFADPSTNPHMLRGLNEKESWELFCIKAFSDARSCPSELVLLGKEMIEKCRGLPLAIVVLGGLMTSKERTVDAWSGVLASVNSELIHDTSICQQILALSYTDLPSYLKSCFLYIGLFPEDFEIDVKKLTLLWIAEGFVQAQGDQQREIQAENYFNQLINRSLIQAGKRKYHGGPAETCRVHDLLRELAVSKGRKDRFLDIHGNNRSAASTARRISMQPIITNTDAELLSHSNLKLRSLLFFNRSYNLGTWKSTFRKGVQLLRVLDFEGVNLGNSTLSEVWTLIHLEYLGLRKTKLTSLSSDICNLVKLQTLDARDVDINLRIPTEIWRMKHVRHIYFQTFNYNSIRGAGVADVPRSLLTLEISSATWMKGLADVYMELNCIRSLTLRGDLSRQNPQNCYPLNLRELNLEGCSLRSDPSRMLGTLPELNYLRVRCTSYLGNRMTFAAEGFVKLQFLELHELLFEVWTVEEGAMSSLKHLVLSDCEQLKMLPEGLEHVRTLQKIDLVLMPTIRDRVKKNGEDWEKIKHLRLLHY